MPGTAGRIGVKARTLAVVALAVGLLAGCGGARGDSPPEPTDAPPTTYVIIRTGGWSGSLAADDGFSGTISFTVRETEDSTHETLAGGQVVVYDYVIEDLEVVLDVEGFPCPSGAVTGEVRASIRGAIPIDAGAHFSGETAEMTIEGSAFGGASGTVTVVLDGDVCAYGPVAWSAEAG
jgi:hypothetical protein